MIGAEAKRKLMKQLESEPLYWLGAWVKLAAGLLVLLLIAAGPWLALRETGRVITIAGDPAPQANTIPSHSRGIPDRSSQ